MGSGFKSFTAGAVLTASDMNNYLMEQSIMYFATEAARDAALTAEDGMVVYIGSNDVNEGIYTYNGSSWTRPWNMPWGIVHYGFDTTNRTTTGATYVDASTATWTGTPKANRLYKLTVYAGMQLTSATAGYARVAIRDASNNVQNFRDIYTSLTTAPTSVVVEDYFTTAAVSTTRKVSIASPATGTHQLLNASAALRLFIEDVGPAGAPT
jgi:hypothetical protein